MKPPGPYMPKVGEKVAVVASGWGYNEGRSVPRVDCVATVEHAGKRLRLDNGSEYYIRSWSSNWRGYGKTSGGSVTIRAATAEDEAELAARDAEEKRRREEEDRRRSLLSRLRYVDWPSFKTEQLQALADAIDAARKAGAP